MKHHSRPFRTASALAALMIAVVCSAAAVSNSRSASAAPGSGGKTAITIDDYAFHPGDLTVARGTTVVWINRDDDVHTIESKDGPEVFDSPALETGSQFGFTFQKAGTYHYTCSVHPYMHGVIVVR